MARFLEIARSGLAAVSLHPARSAATVGCLVVILAPYLTGLSVSRGVQAEAEASIRYGADLYVTGDQFGRPVPLPLEVADRIRGIDGVTAVTPRIVGVVALGKEGEPAVLVGLPPEHFPTSVTWVAGRLPGSGPIHELAVGSVLARRLRLEVGSVIPPFYRNDAGERLSKVVGVFDSDVSLWASRLVLTTLDSAAAIFNQRGLATDLLVDCRPGYAEAVRHQIHAVDLRPAGGAVARCRTTSREDLSALLPAGVIHREGIFNLFFVLLFVGGGLVVLVTAGFGLSERRREVGILKALGWQSDQVLFRAAVESTVLAAVGAGLSVVLAYLWLAAFHGYGLAGLFHGAPAGPGPVPYRMTPVPALLTMAIAYTLVATGTLYSTWRAASASPREAMR
jgi:ABC-type lipoprotein release transport system permease subunit